MPEMTPERACCACLTVKYDAQLVDSRTETYAECWKCVDCGMMFWKKAHMDQAIHEAEAPLREENQRLRAALEQIAGEYPRYVNGNACGGCGLLSAVAKQALAGSSSALTERDSLLRDEGRKEHGQHVQQFLNDLYAIMVDPLADGEIKVEEMCQQLLAAARRDREFENDAEARDSRMKQLEAFVAKVDAIRNSIVGRQNINWSMHIYPLVAALEEIGCSGEGYEIARPKAEAEIAEIDAALARMKREGAREALMDAARYFYENEMPGSVLLKDRAEKLEKPLEIAGQS